MGEDAKGYTLMPSSFFLCHLRVIRRNGSVSHPRHKGLRLWEPSQDKATPIQGSLALLPGPGAVCGGRGRSCRSQQGFTLHIHTQEAALTPLASTGGIRRARWLWLRQHPQNAGGGEAKRPPLHFQEAGAMGTFWWVI